MKIIVDRAERLLKSPQPSLGSMKFARKRLDARGVQVIDLSRVIPYSEIVRPYAHIRKSQNDRAAGEPAQPEQISGLQRRIAEKHCALRSVGIDPEKDLLLTPGIRATMACLSLALLNPGDVAAYPDPGYRYFRSAICLAEAVPSRYQLADRTDYLANISSLTGRSERKLKALFINYPHNPTGAEVDDYFYRDLLKSTKLTNILIIHDCAYVHPGDADVPSILQAPGSRRKALEMHSFSTTFGLNGLGFVVGHRDAVAILKTVFEMTGLVPDYDTVARASELLDHAGEIHSEYSLAVARRRQILSEGLKELGWRVRAGKRVPFVWARPPGQSSSLAFARRLFIKAGVRVNPGSDFGEGGEGWLRMILHPDERILKEALDRIAHHSRIWQRRYRASS